jgi:hypothetical protein
MSHVDMQIKMPVKIGLKWIKTGGSNLSAWPKGKPGHSVVFLWYIGDCGMLSSQMTVYGSEFRPIQPLCIVLTAQLEEYCNHHNISLYVKGGCQYGHTIWDAWCKTISVSFDLHILLLHIYT